MISFVNIYFALRVVERFWRKFFRLQIPLSYFPCRSLLYFCRNGLFLGCPALERRHVKRNKLVNQAVRYRELNVTCSLFADTCARLISPNFLLFSILHFRFAPLTVLFYHPHQSRLVLGSVATHTQQEVIQFALDKSWSVF